MRVFRNVDEIARAVGEALGTSEWVQITQERVDTFADATGDHQWIHVDVDRARAESPFGGPIAHGYLSLSLLPMLGWQIFTIEGARMGVNYGSNKVRFPSPVPVGSRLRLSCGPAGGSSATRRLGADGGRANPGDRGPDQAGGGRRDRQPCRLLGRRRHARCSHRRRRS